MGLLESLNARDARVRRGMDDVLGFDPLARVFLRGVAGLGRATLVQVQGAPGSGKTEFMRRCVHLIEEGRDTLGEAAEALHPVAAWYNPWVYGRQGNLLAGLVGAICKVGRSAGLSEKGRDLVNSTGRIRLDGTVAEVNGSALSPGEVDPVDRLRRGFVQLVDAARGEASGRLLVFVQDLDQLAPSARLAFLDAARLILGGDPELTLVVGLGREAALSAVRSRDPGLSDLAAERVLSGFVDLVISVPGVPAAAVETVLRRVLGPRVRRIEAAFGADAVPSVAEAIERCGPVGPRMVERLGARLHLLAEMVLDRQATVALSPAQWGWIVLAEQWPDFRRFVLRGGEVRWAELVAAVVAGGRGKVEVENELEEWLATDPLLAEFLFVHTDAFVREPQSLRQVESFLVAAGF